MVEYILTTRKAGPVRFADAAEKPVEKAEEWELPRMSSNSDLDVTFKTEDVILTMNEPVFRYVI